MSKAGRLFYRLNFGNCIKRIMRPSDVLSFEILPIFLGKIATFILVGLISFWDQRKQNKKQLALKKNLF